MKILIVHNDYAKHSGEEAVVDKMHALFRGLGHETAELRMSTAGLRESLPGKVRGFLAGLYSPAGVRAMRDAIRRERPDVVNVHNLYPFISPAALRECKKAGVPVVMTVHNFRLICPTGLFMRNGGPCELCLQQGNEWACIRHNCENSRLKSLGYALRNMIARRRRHYLDCVDAFACITDFQRQKLRQAGYPSEKLHLIPNSIDLPADTPRPQSHTAPNYFAFLGRLSAEKGIDLIFEVARRHPEMEFRLAGECRDESLLAGMPGNVRPMGFLSGTALRDFIAGARAVVMASRCYEGFPMAILEAASYSRPSVGPAHGGFPEIIGEPLLLFAPGDADALEQTLLPLWQDSAVADRLGETANRRLRERYTTETTARLWERLLGEVKGV